MIQKTLLLFITAFLHQTIYCQLHSGEVIYKVKAIERNNQVIDSLESNHSDSYNYFKRKRKKNARIMPYLRFILKFNNRASIFRRQKGMRNDNGMDLKTTAMHVRGEDRYYINIEKNIRLQVHQSEKTWLIEKKVDQINWVIHKETRKIKGYRCRRATASVNLNSVRKGQITAWFTQKLPFQFGPIGFAGLPGLILGLKMQDFYYYADRIRLEKKDQEITPPKKGKHISYKRYTEKSKESFKKELRRRIGN